MQKVSLLCDKHLDISLTREFEAKDVDRTGFVTKAEKEKIEKIKAERSWISKYYLTPLRMGGKKPIEFFKFSLDKFRCITLGLKWGYQVGLEPRDVILSERVEGPLSLKIVPGVLSIDDTKRVFLREIIDGAIPIGPYFLSEEFKFFHITIPFGVTTSYEELYSRLFADVCLEKEHENLDKETFVYLGVCSFTHMLCHTLISVKELRGRVAVWPGGLPFRWSQGSSKATKEDFSVGKAHFDEGVRLIALFLVKNSKKKTSERSEISLEKDGQWQTDPLDLSDEGEACRPTFLQQPKSPFVGIERLKTNDTYHIEKGVIVLSQAVAVDTTTKPTEESFSLIHDLFENFESNMKKARGEKQ